ncbi:hypothetical protein BDR26DRAFT_898583 [Obelidium mucronatum]|nr:hypothetical protein BDR26DRAFT_898583 [Obelidium mucronatum]
MSQPLTIIVDAPAPAPASQYVAFESLPFNLDILSQEESGGQCDFELGGNSQDRETSESHSDQIKVPHLLSREFELPPTEFQPNPETPSLTATSHLSDSIIPQPRSDILLSVVPSVADFGQERRVTLPRSQMDSALTPGRNNHHQTPPFHLPDTPVARPSKSNSFFRLKRGCSLPSNSPEISNLSKRSEKEQMLIEKSKKLLSLLEPDSEDEAGKPARRVFGKCSHADDDHFKCGNGGDDVVVVAVNVLGGSKSLFEEPEEFCSSDKLENGDSNFSSKSGPASYTCPVCWESRCVQELVIIGECGHEATDSFCFYCLREWIEKSSECPYCRNKFEVKPLTARIKKARLATMTVKTAQRFSTAFGRAIKPLTVPYRLDSEKRELARHERPKMSLLNWIQKMGGK